MAVALLAACSRKNANAADKSGTGYYISTSGNDNNSGDKNNPWQTIEKLNSILLKAGDSVFLKSGETFTGTLLISDKEKGTEHTPIIVTSYGGSENAIINSGAEKGIEVNFSAYIDISHISVTGAGRKTGNTKNGLSVLNSNHVSITEVSISGYQKSGLLIHSSASIKASKVYAFDNGYAGISVSGNDYLSKNENRDIIISGCRAENNAGDPTNTKNHSGNGIIVSHCTNVLIEYCTATNNGWDMPRIGNGPVGIWAWNADSVVIDHCISYRNKTSAGGEDGGGFDFDGGVTNSTIQYCLSYENDGSGVGLFEYANAGPWYNNTLRYSISVDDGLVSAAKAGIYIWNSSYNDTLKDCFVYNNVIYNSKNAALHYSPTSVNKGFRFYNNIFVAKDEIIKGKESSGEFIANNWWNLSGGFNIEGIKDFSVWANTKNKEQLNGSLKGVNTDPLFDNATNIHITDPHQLKNFYDYKTPAGSLLRTKGIDLDKLFGIKTGSKDFNGNEIIVTGIGASF